VGGPINQWLDNWFDEELELVVPETPPQEVMEVLRDMLIREEVNWEVNREANLLVRNGRALLEYEDAPK